MNQTHSEVQFCHYAYSTNENRRRSSSEVCVAILTSLRDVGLCDRNGEKIETREGARYMEGAIERLVRETYPGGDLACRVEVVGIITDDTERDLEKSQYSVVPQPGRSWIFPPDMPLPDGRRARDIVYNIPSRFRALPRSAVAARREAKFEFENSVLELMQKLGADVLISDHYMARIDYLFPPRLERGRVLNIHPAVTLSGHPFCFRGRTPTADAIARASQNGLRVMTGATLHVINERIDDGPVVAYIADTSVYPDDEAQWLRYRNYQQAKLPLLVAGLIHYTRCIYPYLPDIDFSRPVSD